MPSAAVMLSQKELLSAPKGCCFRFVELCSFEASAATTGLNNALLMLLLGTALAVVLQQERRNMRNR
jgi:hypothetical protein